MYSKIRNVIVVMLMATSSIWAAGAAAGNEIVTYRTDDFGYKAPTLFALAAQKVRDGYTGTDLEGMLKAQSVPQDAIDRMQKERHLEIPRLVRANPEIRTAILAQFERIRPSLEVTQETSDAMRQWLKRLMVQGILSENDPQRELITALLKEEILSHDNPLSRLSFEASRAAVPLIYAGVKTESPIITPEWHIPLIVYAAKNGLTAAVQALAKAGADVDAREVLLSNPNRRGETALIRASRDGNENMVRTLIAAGADVNLSADIQDCPLIEAVKYGRTNIIRDLLAAGANVNRRSDASGYTALMEAAALNDVHLAMALLALGADKNIANYEGETPLRIADEHGHSQIAILLRVPGASSALQLAYYLSQAWLNR